MSIKELRDRIETCDQYNGPHYVQVKRTRFALYCKLQDAIDQLWSHYRQD